MQIIHDIQRLSLANSWLTIGTFDGVHVGHQSLIRPMVENAHAVGALAVVMTFDPHPAVVLRGRVSNTMLTTIAERAELIASLGVDILVVQPFSLELAATSARDFIQMVVKHLEIRQLWVGHDFALGRSREGDVAALSALGQDFGFRVIPVEAVWQGQEVISSNRIRLVLQTGAVSTASRLLGRPYRLYGEVVQGDQRGRTLGIPTANLIISSEKLLPEKGVYACWAYLGEKGWPAAVNIGVRPTFDGKSPAVHVEAHLIGFDGDLYGKRLSFDFIERLRGEQRFQNADALVTQIHLDIERTLALTGFSRDQLTSQHPTPIY